MSGLLAGEAKNRTSMRLMTRALITGIAGGAAALAAVFGTVHHSADRPSVASVAQGAPAYAVENYAYPHADEILAEQGIVLKRGNGRILLAECDSEAGLLEVWSRSAPERICFRTTGGPGYLSLEVPSVYVVKGGDDASTVTMTYDGAQSTVDVPEDTWTPVGEGTDPGHEYALLEIVTGG
ncbi:hypothetical protein [Peterkaempfera sp. SMS 1(5)a]|uniref:hypothetical protein n=1 Tax=Peterkaempfera podocarpi TaxID=3232308 RepID=UPI0036721699